MKTPVLVLIKRANGYTICNREWLNLHATWSHDCFPMACIEDENSAMGLSIERTAIQYMAASGSSYVQHGSTIALGWFSLHTKWVLNGP